MKKIVRTLCLVAMVALVATSCKKKEENANVTVDFEETTGFEVGPSIDGSRAWIDVNNGSVFKWNEHDQIAFYNLSSDPTRSTCTVLDAVEGSEGKVKTQFTGPSVGSVQEKGYFVFFHPEKAAAAQGNPLGAGNRESFTVSANQDYNPAYMIDPKSLVMACKAPNVGVFTLQHIFGFLNIGIYNGTSDMVVDYITVEDKVNNLAGNVNLKLDEVDPDELKSMIDHLAQYGEDATYQAALADYVLGTLGYNASNQSKTITLNCGGTSGTLNKNGYTYFFVSLRPGALRNSFTVTIHYKNGTSYSHDFNTPLEYTIKPGNFRNIYAVSDGRWYINGQWKY